MLGLELVRWRRSSGRILLSIFFIQLLGLFGRYCWMRLLRQREFEASMSASVIVCLCCSDLRPRPRDKPELWLFGEGKQRRTVSCKGQYVTLSNTRAEGKDFLTIFLATSARFNWESRGFGGSRITRSKWEITRITQTIFKRAGSICWELRLTGRI